MSIQSIDEIESALGGSNLLVRDLYAIWELQQPVPEAGPRKAVGEGGSAVRQIPWYQRNLRLARRFTSYALEKEEFLLVCDAAPEILRVPGEPNEEDRIELVRVRMDYAAALLRLGFTRAARRELEPCIAEGFALRLKSRLQADILLQLGNIVREESHHASARAVRLQTAGEALAFYQRALEIEPDRLDAMVLTAAASLIAGNAVAGSSHEQARDRARGILAHVERLRDAPALRVPAASARAIALAILGETDAAAQSFAELSGLDGITTSHLADVRYRVQFLAEALGKPRDFFKPAFPALQLIVFAGHLPDLPDRRGVPARFPPESVDLVRHRLKQMLQQADARAGLVSAAAGADLLFIEALRARQGTVHLVLPWSQEEFRKTSVCPYDLPGGQPLWEPLFDAAIGDAATVRELGQAYEPGSDVGWEYATEVTAGLALHIARASRLDVQPMALWDGLPGRGPGGTESFVEFWRQQLHNEPVILNLPVPSVGGTEVQPALRRVRCEQSTLQQQVKSMLFADIVGYSKLTEHVIPEFVGTFLDRVSQIAATSKYAPRSVNTWGDAIYAVFDFAHEAGCFALELTRMIQEGEAEWLQKGLYWEDGSRLDGEPIRHPLNIRIGLHTGPVFIHYDPIVRRLGFTGAHVNRAARIEPVAKPGEVYASEEFAALADLGTEMRRRDGSGNAGPPGAGFVCEYAGTMSLAKGFPGRHRIYRVIPDRPFATEELARAAHDFYCDEARARGETPDTNSALRPWDDLSDNLREANRTQVADIPNKLRFLGYELTPGFGTSASGIAMSDAQVEELSIREHDRWAKDRRRHGWTYAARRDNARKHHPLLVPWPKLSEPEKEKDRDTVRNMPRLVEKAGFRVRRLPGGEKA